MGLSIRLATGVSFAFIGTICWLISQVSPPRTTVDSPLEMLPFDRMLAAMAGPAPVPSRPIESPDVLRTFEQPSMIATAQAEAEQANEARFAAAEAEQARKIALLNEAGQRVASAVEPADGTFPPRRLPAGGSFVMTAPMGLPAAGSAARDAVAAGSNAQPASPEALLSGPMREHVVARGDSLVRIAKRYYGSSDRDHLDALLAANPELRDHPNRIVIGESVRVPAADDVERFVAAQNSPQPDDIPLPPQNLITERPPRLASSQTLEAESGGARETVVAGAQVTDLDAQIAAALQPEWYTVKERDSLIKIARTECDDPELWREIAELNGIRDARRITPGMKLKLPPAVAGL